MSRPGRIAFVLFVSLSAIAAIAHADPRTFRRGSVALSIESDDQHSFSISATNNARSNLPVHGSIVISAGRREVTTCDFDIDEIAPGATETTTASCSYEDSGDIHWGIRWR